MLSLRFFAGSKEKPLPKGSGFSVLKAWR